MLNRERRRDVWCDVATFGEFRVGHQADSPEGFQVGHQTGSTEGFRVKQLGR